MLPELEREQTDKEEQINVVKLLQENFENLPREILDIYKYVQDTNPDILFPSFP